MTFSELLFGNKSATRSLRGRIAKLFVLDGVLKFSFGSKTQTLSFDCTGNAGKSVVVNSTGTDLELKTLAGDGGLTSVALIDLTDGPGEYADEAADGGKMIRINNNGDGFIFTDPSEIIPTNVIGAFSDLPDDYENQAGKALIVNQAEDAMEFADIEFPAQAFTDLTDGPEAYAAEGADAGKVLMVNSEGDGIEFGDIEIPSSALTDLSDGPEAYAAVAADAGKVLRVNGTGDGFEFDTDGLTQDVTVVISVTEGVPALKVLSFVNGILTAVEDPA